MVSAQGSMAEVDSVSAWDSSPDDQNGIEGFLRLDAPSSSNSHLGLKDGAIGILYSLFVSLQLIASVFRFRQLSNLFPYELGD